jgi:hypothetical protein
MYLFDYCSRECDDCDELFVEKQNLEKAARELLKVAREALPPDGEARARYESAVLAMETLLGEPIEK